MEKSDTDKHYAWLGKLIAEDRTSEESTCDLVLESEGNKFPVHKNIMMLVSKYFKKMFTVEMKEKYEGIVKMLQIPPQRLANLIEFIYCGRIEITEDNVTDILDDAEYTELEALKEICKRALLKLVSADNCLKLRAYAQRYNLDEVFVKTNQEITTSFAEVVRQDDFVQLNIEDMSAVIKLRNNGCEAAVFTGVLKWVNHNPVQREEYFTDLFLQIDLSLTSTQFLTEASKERLVRNNIVCSNYLVDKLLQTLQGLPSSDGLSKSVRITNFPNYVPTQSGFDKKSTHVVLSAVKLRDKETTQYYSSTLKTYQIPKSNIKQQNSQQIIPTTVQINTPPPPPPVMHGFLPYQQKFMSPNQPNPVNNTGHSQHATTSTINYSARSSKKT